METSQNFATWIWTVSQLMINLKTPMQTLQEILRKDLIHRTMKVKHHFPQEKAKE